MLVYQRVIIRLSNKFDLYPNIRRLPTFLDFLTAMATNHTMQYTQ